MSLSGHAAENKAQHRNIASNAKRCEIVVKKPLAPGKAELPNEGLLHVVDDLAVCMKIALAISIDLLARSRLLVLGGGRMMRAEVF